MKNTIKKITSLLLIFSIFLCYAFISYAETGKEKVDNAELSVKTTNENGEEIESYIVYDEQQTARREAAKAIPIDTNNIKNWPQGPVNTATAAILMDIDTGVCLYSKDINDRLFPASITKILTALIACERCKKDDKVVFTESATITNMEAGSASMGFKEGEEITMEQALSCMLVGSANEVANAIAETVAGSNEKFADMMNERAKKMGCRDSHFTNPSGLHDDDHYITAHDYAIICANAYKNEWFRKVCCIPRYQRPTTNISEGWEQANNHRMFTDTDYFYENCTGGKTGGTDKARSTLVTYAEKNGIKLVAVCLYGFALDNYDATRELFEYGFNDFSLEKIKSLQSKYSLYNEDKNENKEEKKSKTKQEQNSKSSKQNNPQKKVGKKTLKHRFQAKVKEILKKGHKELIELLGDNGLIILLIAVVIAIIITVVTILKRNVREKRKAAIELKRQKDEEWLKSYMNKKNNMPDISYFDLSEEIDEEKKAAAEEEEEEEEEEEWFSEDDK